MTETRLFLLQRISALVLAPMVILHLVVILYATRAGLSAEAILARTGSTPLWPVFYALFVVAAAVHAPIGLRNILREWTPLSRGATDWLSLGFGVVLLVLGLRAVWAVSGWAA